MKSMTRTCFTAAMPAAAAIFAAPAFAQAGVGDNYRWVTFAVFAAVIAVTMAAVAPVTANVTSAVNATA